MHSLRAGRRKLWQQQAADGSWAAACDMGPAATAYVVAALGFIGKLDRETAAQASLFLRRQQAEGGAEDGSVPGRPFERRGDVGATATVWAALHFAGGAENLAAASRARAYVERNGGAAALVRLFYEGDPAAVFVAMAGLLPPDALDEITPPILTNVAPGASLFTRKVSVILPWRGFVFGVILRSLPGSRSLARRLPTDWLIERERTLCLASLDRTSNPDGSWLYGDTLHASLALAALFAMGKKDDARSVNALAWMTKQTMPAISGKDARAYTIFQSDVWTTAFDLRALIAAGARPSRLGMARATRWLLDCQNNGSWAFQQRNTAMPDSDDVGVVLASLAEAKTAGTRAQSFRALDDRLTRAMSAAISWLRNMQNPDGGWPSFQHGLASKPPGPIMTRPLSLESPLSRLLLAIDPPVDAGDPSTEDVTGRVLFGLGKAGLRVGDPAVDRALAFLREQQCMHGGFWGRWVVNYLAGTAWVLRGAAAVGVPASDPWIRRALDFIYTHQREDGGFGEDPASYSDPLSAGEGKASTPGLTGLVLSALVESGAGHAPEAARAAAYLQATQQRDGGWPNGTLVHCLVPPTLFYVLPGAELQLPLEGLGRWAAVTATPDTDEPSQVVTPGEGPRPRRTVADFRKRLEVARGESDRKADAAVAAIRKAGLENVAPVIATITRTRDLVPAGLPPAAAAMFTDTSLPAWADQKRIARAQQLFERCGWAAALSLFASSLPQCYACAEGAKILVHTEELRRNPQRRILETAQFVFDVTSTNAFDPNGRGLRSAQKVRLLHALVRAIVRDKVDVWNPRNGEPISQFYLIGTLMTFSAVVVDGMRTMELEVDDTDADAWVHLWNVVGSLMGIEEDLLPADAREAESLLEAVRELSWAPSDAGRLLTKATLGVMQEHLLPGQALDGVAVMLVRHLAGDHCADLLGLPPSDWTAALYKPFTLAMDLFEIEGTSPLAALLRRASMELMKGLQAAYLGNGRPEFETLETKRLLEQWQESMKSK